MSQREEQAGFFGRLGTLIRSEVPMLRAFAVSAERVTDPDLHMALERILDRAYQGSGLAESFAREAPLFTGEVLCLLEAGEQAGDVERKALDIAEALRSGVFDPGRPRDAEEGEEDPLDRLVREAAEAGATDVHLVPLRAGTRLTYRIGGALTEGGGIDADRAGAMLAWARKRAGVPPGAGSAPRTGTFEAGDLFVRASFCPYAEGEGLVLRLFPAGRDERSLEELLLTPEEAAEIRSWLEPGNGLLLATGPAGSGKNTTLVGMLMELDRERARVTAIESEPWIRVPGVSRVAADPAAGLTLASALEAQLDQDLDAVYVDGIPDRETGGKLVEIALTGHLALAPLGARGAPEAVARLVGLGLDPLDVAACLRGVTSQLLLPARKGGRRPAYEVMGMTPALREAVRADPSAANLRRVAEEGGLVPLRERARALVAEGAVEAADVERLVGA